MAVATIISDSDRVNRFYFFLIFCTLAIAIMWAANTVLISDDLYFDYFGEQLAYERVVELIDISKNWSWIGYFLLPIFYFLKFLFVAITLFIGFQLSNSKVPFKDLFLVVMLGELVFFIGSFIKIFWFGVFFTDYTLQDLQYFSPLSLLSLFDRESVEPWLVYPLQLINLFEAAYWLLLAYGLCSITKERYSKMLGLVTSSYGVGLLLWVVFVVFLTVSISPA